MIGTRAFAPWVAGAAALALLAACASAPHAERQRRAVNPWDWGLPFEMNQAEVVDGASRHVHFSGQLAVVPDPDAELGISVVGAGDMRRQIEVALENVDAVLEAAGFERSDIATLRFFVTDMAAYLANYDVYAAWIAEAGIRPPQTLLGVRELALPAAMIEIEPYVEE